MVSNLVCGELKPVPQEAWVQSGSVKDNITFSESNDESDAARTEHVIRACGLAPDLDRWDDREHTYIGERGITLSGGQRQRICVARAAYADSDIVLLDDPLSALDANVGHHLLHQCILRGPLATRTRILVTHHLDVLPQADWIVVMDSKDDEGRISQQGTYRVGCRCTRSYRSTLTPLGTAQCRWAIPIVGERVWICFGRSYDRAYR
jgi:ATP-binding cassette subfamily C (CFTR/MRP) protein 1